MYFLCIDPGKHAFGWALFEGTHLAACAYTKREALTNLRSLVVAAPFVVRIERPQIYPHSKGDPNDLIDIAIFCGEAAYAFRAYEVEFVLPHAWKGSVPKKVMTDRILNRLTAVERQIVEACGCPKSKIHNVLDAVGLGLWRLKRL